MPNQPRLDNPNRVLRVETWLWTRVKDAASTEGVSPSEWVRRLLVKTLGEK